MAKMAETLWSETWEYNVYFELTMRSENGYWGVTGWSKVLTRLYPKPSPRKLLIKADRGGILPVQVLYDVLTDCDIRHLWYGIVFEDREKYEYRIDQKGNGSTTIKFFKEEGRKSLTTVKLRQVNTPTFDGFIVESPVIIDARVASHVRQALHEACPEVFRRLEKRIDKVKTHVAQQYHIRTYLFQNMDDDYVEDLESTMKDW